MVLRKSNSPSYLQLFVNLINDDDNLTTPSPTTTSSSPTHPNAPSKTPSTNQTSSSQENTSSSFQSKLQISPPSSNQPTSPQPLNPLLDNISDVLSKYAARAALAEYAIVDDHPLTTFADFDGAPS
nr:hypothetical protein [Tanacetum cinerariifolium]